MTTTYLAKLGKNHVASVTTSVRRKADRTDDNYDNYRILLPGLRCPHCGTAGTLYRYSPRYHCSSCGRSTVRQIRCRRVDYGNDLPTVISDDARFKRWERELLVDHYPDGSPRPTPCPHPHIPRVGCDFKD